MKPRILIVDDEPKILQGIQRMLRKMHERWDMIFASGGTEALEIMSGEPCHVVVSDMKMPGMDGVQLLGEIKKKWPKTVRIMLSGYSEQEAVLRTVHVAHRYLAKPCDSGMLVETIARSLRLRAYLNSPNLRRAVAGLGSLPSPPTIYEELAKELDDPAASVKSIANVIGRDIAMSAAVLKLMNSSFFGFSSQVTSIQKAVSLLGFDLIKSLILTVGIFRHFQGNAYLAKRIKEFSSKSMIETAATRSIAGFLKLTELEQKVAISGAMFSDLGSLVMIDYSPDRFEKAHEISMLEGSSLIDAERKIFGATHSEIAAYLLGLWGFSDAIIEVVAFHHEPSRIDHAGPTAATALHVSHILCRSEGGRGERPLMPKGLDIGHLESIGVLADLEKFWGACDRAIMGSKNG